MWIIKRPRMSQILNGEIIRSEGTENANGGTELMMNRMVRDVPSELLSKVQIIHSRLNTVKIETDRPTILVCHDLPNDPMYQRLTNPEILNKIDVIVFVSYWQKQYFNLVLGLPHEKSVVIQNGIEPFNQISKPDAKDRVNLIYHTTPHRGLEILIPVFEKLCEKYGDKIHLDVFSSFKAYGWEERDEQYKSLFVSNDNITYHGFQPNDVVRKALTQSHIYAYPCIWPETSCLSVIEAMASGNHVVCPDLAVLPETTANFADMYGFKENLSDHANVFGAVLDNAIQNVHLKETGFQEAYFNTVYNWNDRISRIWEVLLKGM